MDKGSEEKQDTDRSWQFRRGTTRLAQVNKREVRDKDRMRTRGKKGGGGGNPLLDIRLMLSCR